MAKTRRRTRRTKEKTNSPETYEDRLERLRRDREAEGPSQLRPGDPTQERYDHAADLGQQIRLALNLDSKGFATGEWHWRVDDDAALVVDHLTSRGIFEPALYNAAWKFMALCRIVQARGSPKVMSWIERYDNHGRELEPVERAVNSVSKIKAAFNAVEPEHRIWLWWLSGCMTDCRTVAQVMYKCLPHSRDRPERTRREVGQELFGFALAKLADHFGEKAPHRYSHLSAQTWRVATEIDYFRRTGQKKLPNYKKSA